MKPLTDIQQQVLSYIIDYQKKTGVPPTIREIAAELNFNSLNNVRQHLQLIDQKGYIRLMPGRARGIEIRVGYKKDIEGNGIQVPVVGTVAAGKPITAIENITDHITLDRKLFDSEGLFTLKIKGDSMEGIGVNDGDFVVVRQQAAAENGDVVVAIIEDEATLKRFIKKKGAIILRAENPKYNDIVIPKERDVWIAGMMVGLIRKCK